MSEPFLLSVREFARAEGLGRDTAYQLVRQGRIRAVKVGRRVLIPRSEIGDWPARELEEEGVIDDMTSRRNGKGPVAVKRSGP